MAERAERAVQVRATAIAVVAAVVLAGVVIVVTNLTGGGAPSSAAAEETTTTAPSTIPSPTPPANDDNDENGDAVNPSPLSQNVLAEPMSGQEAIDALGEKIEAVAKRNGKTVDELKDLLLRDKTAQVSTSGFIVYIDTFKN